MHEMNHDPYLPTVTEMSPALVRYSTKGAEVSPDPSRSTRLRAPADITTTYKRQSDVLLVGSLSLKLASLPYSAAAL